MKKAFWDAGSLCLAMDIRASLRRPGVCSHTIPTLVYCSDIDSTEYIDTTMHVTRRPTCPLGPPFPVFCDPIRGGYAET